MATTRVRAEQIVGLQGFPEAFLYNLIPSSNRPQTTGDFILEGAFFTPTMTIVFEGQTINTINFVSDNKVIVNITTGANEGMYDITLNNGSGAIVFPDALFLVLGDVFEPIEAEWINVAEPINFQKGKILTQTFTSVGAGEWTKTIDTTKDISLRFTLEATPLDPTPRVSGGTSYDMIEIRNASTNALMFAIWNYNCQNIEAFSYASGSRVLMGRYAISGNLYDAENKIEYINGVWYFKGGKFNLNHAHANYQTMVDNCKIICRVGSLDLINFKLIELA